MTSGMPASRSASIPARAARRATRSGHAPPPRRARVCRGNAEFTPQIEGAPAARQLDDIRHVVNGFKRGLSLLALNQAQDVLVQHALAEARWDGADELITAQDAFDVAIVEDALSPRQTQRRAGDAHLKTGGGGLLAVVNLPAGSFQSLGEQATKFVVPITVRRDRRRRDGGGSNCRQRHWFGVVRWSGDCRLRERRFRWNLDRSFSQSAAQSSGIHGAQRLVERRNVADFGMIREQRNHIAAFAEHFLSKSLQRLLRPDFNIDASPSIVERV